MHSPSHLPATAIEIGREAVPHNGFDYIVIVPN